MFACVCCLLAVTVLLYLFLETFGFPDDLQCHGKREGGQIHFTVLPDITAETRGCETQWLVNVIVLLCKKNRSYID